MKKNATKSICLVVLNKNDADSLDLILKEIDFKLFDQVIGIDGNSVDHSRKIFKKHNIPFINIKFGGRGGAIRHAINTLNYDFLIFLSSDGEEDPADLIKIKKLLLKNNDLVIASRMKKKSGFKSDYNFFYLHRKFFLYFITKMINFLFEGNIKDCWNGYRGLDTIKARDINLVQNDFLLEAEMTIKFLKRGYAVKEFSTIERVRYFGKSQNPALSSGWGHIVLLFKEYFRKDLR